jgi:hypothetical protein
MNSALCSVRVNGTILSGTDGGQQLAIASR